MSGATNPSPLENQPDNNSAEDKSRHPQNSPPVAEPTPVDGVPTPADLPIQEITPEQELPPEPPTIKKKVKTLLVGKPLSLEDKAVFKHISLVAFLAWVGLGADGLSSSCYGPSEAFHHLIDPKLGDHTRLAAFLVLAIIFTVVVISLCYRRIIAAFPSGGGGYLVASKLLGRPVGVVSGCALVWAGWHFRSLMERWPGNSVPSAFPPTMRWTTNSGRTEKLRAMMPPIGCGNCSPMAR